MFCWKLKSSFPNFSLGVFFQLVKLWGPWGEWMFFFCLMVFPSLEKMVDLYDSVTAGAGFSGT